MNPTFILSLFFGDITEASIKSLIDITLQAKRLSASEIQLRISSAGGNLHAGFAAYHHLKSLDLPVTTYNFGNVESSAILLFLAGNNRLAAPYSTFLLHSFSWTLGNETVRH